MLSMSLLFACASKNNSAESADNLKSANASSNIKGKEKLTKEMAYNGVNNYCHQNFDWSVAKDNHDIMYVEMGEETDTEYQATFRSYTGSFTYFYVNKSSHLG